MLILNRKNGQELVVPQYGIVMKIVEIRGNQVRVGISAPHEAKVYRGEVWKRVQDSASKIGPWRKKLSPPTAGRGLRPAR